MDFLYKILELEGTEDEIIKEITEQEETKDFLVKLLQVQLYNSGEDGNNQSLGVYSELTKKIKSRKGQPIDRITLKDTGLFYESYFILAEKGYFIIDANGLKETVKGGKTDLFAVYGDDILKPNDETLLQINEYYNEKIIEYIENIIQKYI